MTRECISLIFDQRDILLSQQICFSFVNCNDLIVQFSREPPALTYLDPYFISAIESTASSKLLNNNKIYLEFVTRSCKDHSRGLSRTRFGF